MNRKKRKWGLILILSLLGLCLGVVSLFAVINLFVPSQTIHPDQLADEDIARVLEAQHLRQELGDQVFPGFGTVEIPALIYNEENAFLISIANPQTGWVKVPQELTRGGDWKTMPPLEAYPQEIYFRTGYDPKQEPDAFTVRVGDIYVGSLPSADWFRLGLMNQFRKDLPGFLKPVFPYSLVASIFFPNSDTYLSMIQHESFHAFQAVWAQSRFEAAEWDGIRLVDQYPWENQAGIDAWQQELDVLKAALKSQDKEEIRQLAQQFLDLRDARRKNMKLSADLIRYENQREWVEGMARYTELETWRLAATDEQYQPLADMQSDRKFKEYQTFDNRWSRELDQISRMANDEGDGRFYYSGMAQAYLLDQLHPSWKLTLAADPTLNLEDLLRQALTVK
ncbi:MAG: hypothetical protein IH585_10095 [Anaerolineaceae bacterium]|nr:hypothetical protein [Anaerolineaceae bacterium]